MTWALLASHLCKFILLVLFITGALELYFATFAESIAKKEAMAPAATGWWYLWTKVGSCRLCLTYWFGILGAVALWILPAIAWLPSTLTRAPAVLVVGVGAAILVRALEHVWDTRDQE